MGTRQPTPMTRQAAERIATAATRDPSSPTANGGFTQRAAGAAARRGVVAGPDDDDLEPDDDDLEPVGEPGRA